MMRVALGRRARRRRGRSRAPRPSLPATCDAPAPRSLPTSVCSPASATALLTTCAMRCSVVPGGERELLVVAHAPLRVGQDPARVVDEAQRFLDVALAVARLRVVLADQPAQGGPHVLVGGGGQNPERFVQRCLHAARLLRNGSSIMPLESLGEKPRLASLTKARSGPWPEISCFRPVASGCPARVRKAKRPATGPFCGSPRHDGRRKRPAIRPCRLPCARAFRECAPTCPSARAGSRASRGGRRPCASPRSTPAAASTSGTCARRLRRSRSCAR